MTFGARFLFLCLGFGSIVAAERYIFGWSFENVVLGALVVIWANSTLGAERR